jgi:hypothetical protein
VNERNDPTRLDEAALCEHLKGGSAVSQRYREISNDEVPADLDQRVLAMAHAAAATGKARERNWRRSAWIAPLALAASAVLVVSIVIESGVYRDKDPVDARAVFAPQQPESAPAEVSADALLADQKAEPAAAPPAETQVSAPIPAPAAARADEAARLAVEAKRAQQILEQTARIRTEEREFAASPPPAAAAEAESAKTDIPSAVATAPSRQDHASVSAPVALDDTDLSEIAVTGVRARRDAAGGGSGPRNTVRPAGSRGDEATDAADAQRAPGTWLDSIRELRQQGRDRDADKEWKRFRERHPDYVVAEDDRARPSE